MSTTDADTLYGLLPAFIRLRDVTEGGGVLQALVAVIAGQAQVVDAGLDQLYDDQFIETCAPWVIPYIGDLIGFTPLQPLGPGQAVATRAEVADTIGYRRRKGTLSMLEQLCSDVTGWPCVAVEFFEVVATTQYVRNHLRPQVTAVDVHSPMTAVQVGSAFDTVPRSIDVRRIDSGRGRYNLPNIGLFVWRLQPFPNVGHPARSVGANRYTFDPFGGDVPIVNQPVSSDQTFNLTEQVNLPYFLQRYPMYARIQPNGASPQTPPPVTVTVNGTPVASTALAWCDLRSWTAPTAAGVIVAVDPVLGRLVFAAPPTATDVVTVDFTYVFSGQFGGGDYERTVPASQVPLEAPLTALPPVALAEAQLTTASNEVVHISDSGILDGDLTLTPGANLLVIQGDDGERPVLTGNLTISAVAGTSVTLRGVGIGGSLTLSGVGPVTLRLEHCTVRGTLDWSATGVIGSLVLDHSLCGPLEANDSVDVTICDSALDAGTDTAVALSGGSGTNAGSVTISSSTIVGSISARTIPLLENSIVTGPVVSIERQAGCLRYSFAPLAGSQSPRRFRCQPDLEVANEVASALTANPALTPAESATIQSNVESWLLPAFTSRTAGQPGYLQLADAAPDQIRYGATDDDEMGIFYSLFSARMESNLVYRINEYLRIGLATGIIHAT
jgi:hypothetical protein